MEVKIELIKLKLNMKIQKLEEKSNSNRPRRKKKKKKTEKLLNKTKNSKCLSKEKADVKKFQSKNTGRIIFECFTKSSEIFKTTREKFCYYLLLVCPGINLQKSTQKLTRQMNILKHG